MAVELKKLVDVRIDSASTLSVTHDAILGPSNLVRQTFRPTSSSATSLDFVIQTPGLAVYMSRKVMVSIKIPFKFKVRNYSDEPVIMMPGLNVGSTAFPINSMISTATVQISTSSFTTQVQQTLPLVKRLLQRPDSRRKFTGTSTGVGDTLPILPAAQSSYFQSAIETGNDPHGDGCYGNQTDYNLKIEKYTDLAGNVIAANNCPIATYVSGELQTATDTIVSGYMNVVEPLLCQPFEFDDEQPAFINVNLISVRLNLSPLNAELCRLVRFAVAPMITTDTVTSGVISMPQWQPFDLALDDSVQNIFSDATAICQFFSPPPTSVVPTKSIYPTTYMNPLPTADTQSTNSGPVEVVSNVITLNTAPDAVAIYFVPQFDASAPSGAPSPFAPVTNARGLQLEDYVSKIRSLDITWNNNPSLLRTFTQNELWQRSYENGLPQAHAVYGQNLRDTDFQQSRQGVNALPLWTGGTTTAGGAAVVASSGGCILLMLNKDIPVEPGVAAGVAGVYTLQIKATVETAFIPSNRGVLYIVPINSQYLILNAGATSDLLTTVATEEQVASTPASGDVQTKSLMGGAVHTMASRASREHIGGAHMVDSKGGYATGGGVSAGGYMHAGSDGAGAGKRARNMYM